MWYVCLTKTFFDGRRWREHELAEFEEHQAELKNYFAEIEGLPNNIEEAEALASNDVHSSNRDMSDAEKRDLRTARIEWWNPEDLNILFRDKYRYFVLSRSRADGKMQYQEIDREEAKERRDSASRQIRRHVGKDHSGFKVRY